MVAGSNRPKVKRGVRGRLVNVLKRPLTEDETAAVVFAEARDDVSTDANWRRQKRRWRKVLKASRAVPARENR